MIVVFVFSFMAISQAFFLESLLIKHSLDKLALTSEPTDDNVKFFLYTQSNPLIPQPLMRNNVSVISSSNYDPSNPTTIIIHGFMSSMYSDLVSYNRNQLLKKGPYNIIAVDWSSLAENFDYVTVAGLTKPVGQFISQFVDFLVERGLKLKDLHIMGHSLGAHVSGFTAKSMKSGKVSRISGFDPAMPEFTGKTAEDRLDASDAEFVDCIHTCGGQLGLIQPICHADFYPNGGEVQPGCGEDITGSCSHSRSYYLYAESIEEGHVFKTKQCSKIPVEVNTVRYFCQPSSALMGDPATKQFTGYFYLETNSAYPYVKS